jgi:PhoPQ-activated pathogenicity-related protein
VLLWQASNPKARDFRLETIGPAWTSTPVTGVNGIYAVKMPKPSAGFTAYFLELTFPGLNGSSLLFTTQIAVTPNTYPFPAPAGSENISPPSGADGRKTAQSIH